MATKTELQAKFNDFWRNFFKEVDFYSLLSKNDLIGLKKAVSDINNIITIRTTESFVDYFDKTNISIDHQKAKDIIHNISANANGYDFVYPDANEPLIIAEVKCNIPWGDKEFGSGQKEGIIRDLIGLMDKKESAQNVISFENAIKFLVLLDDDNSKAKQSMKKLYKEIDRHKIVKQNAKYLTGAKNDLKALMGTKQANSISQIIEDHSNSETKTFSNDKIHVVYIK